MKKLFKITVWVVGSVVAFAAIYFAAMFVCSRIAISAEKGAAAEVEIFIKTNGAHTDIVMPVVNDQKDWSVKLPYSNNVSQDTDYPYIAIGWGDKAFFIDMPTWEDLTFRLAFNAAFWLNRTAMHTTYYKQIETGDDCRRIMISREQYARLITFIEKRFQLNDDGSYKNIKTDAAYGDSDAFYWAKGHYNLFYSCNTWANDALAACGQRHCLWTFFDDPIFAKYDEK